MMAGSLRTIGVALLAAIAAPAAAQDAPAPHDLLNAVLWMQRSVEYKANSEGTFALARMRLDQALADKTWTAAPVEQTGEFGDKPPAIVLDLDETALDNSNYQVWMIKAGRTFEQKTWTAYVQSQTSVAIPGAVDFAKYADSRGVKVFYVSNRLAEGEEEPTRELAKTLGFPDGGNVDVFLTTRKKPDWTSAKGTRRAYIAKDYRIVLNLGDNFADFTDDYRGSEADRLKVYEANKGRWGREWIMLANPSYGSFEAAPFGFDYKKPAAEQRKAKLDAIQGWTGPSQN